LANGIVGASADCRTRAVIDRELGISEGQTQAAVSSGGHICASQERRVCLEVRHIEWDGVRAAQERDVPWRQGSSCDAQLKRQDYDTCGRSIRNCQTNRGRGPWRSWCWSGSQRGLAATPCHEKEAGHSESGESCSAHRRLLRGVKVREECSLQRERCALMLPGFSQNLGGRVYFEGCLGSVSLP